MPTFTPSRPAAHDDLVPAAHDDVLPVVTVPVDPVVPIGEPAASCPVSYATIDARAARLSATATALLLVAYLVTGSWPILAVVVGDYVVRVATRRRAPLGMAAAAVLGALDVPPRSMDRAPKAFAWGVGFLLALLSLALVPAAPTASLVVAAVLAGFSALDGVGNVCVGCLAYRHVVRPLRARRPAPRVT